MSDPTTPAAGDWPLELFRRASSSIPAYADFLRRRGCDPALLVETADFGRVPVTTKQNYLRSYPLADLMWDGSLDGVRLMASSTGSSGTPCYWPQNEDSLREAVLLNAPLFDTFGCRERSTLCVISFFMGVHVAGTYQLQAALRLARQGYRLTVISPGIDIDENVRALRDVAPGFEQTVVMGYPPLVRDVLVAASAAGVPLEKLRLRLLFSGESFSESWREGVHRAARTADPLTGSLGIYGSADAGIIGVESPLSVYVRRAAAEDPELCEALFPGAGSLPALVEFDPRHRHVEDVDGHLVLTVRSGLPLIRYRIGDVGRVISAKALSDAMARCGRDVPDDLARPSTGHFVGLYGRTDVMCTLYGVNIFPDDIKDGLERPDPASETSGRFLLAREDAETGGQFLRLRVELAPGATGSASLRRRVEQAVGESLRASNGEYRKLEEAMPGRCTLDVVLLPYGDPAFARTGKSRRVAP
ncbi:phenylacetate--CoA ligase family protein [Streptomyces sp. NRRL F-5123]|uniref:phenylacetate--CoA ligase family protein n=1 Tax=Streptomyces sp. NRRL F-5123 TaxID=1463856 RepID=UPI000694D3F4|nr:phenylacetate--CoA ligase family protein [Streptomyces sp. NRRL F-5123]